VARRPPCPFCRRRETAEIIYGSPKLDARLRRRIEEGHAVLGGPAAGQTAKWACRCGSEFGGSSELSAAERLDLILRQARALTSVDSDLRTAGLIHEALAVEKARRVLLSSARADAEDDAAQRAVAALQPTRPDVWSEDDTVLAYALLRHRPGFPGEKDVQQLARTLGRSRGAVIRKLAALNVAGDLTAARPRRRTTEQKIVRIYAKELEKLRRYARKVLLLRRQPAAVGPRRRATRATRFEFWSALNDLMDREGTTVKVRPADSRNWKGYSIGRAGFGISVTLSTREQRVGCELYIGHRDAKHAFDQLELERSSIERALGPLEWQRLPAKRACRIVQYRAAVLGDPEEWPALLSWCKERVEAFHKAFAHRVETLVLVKR